MPVTVTELVDTLELGAGLVTVTVDNSDRRSRRLKLTPAGRALLARAVPVWRRTHAEIERLLPSSGADRLRRALGALT